MAFFKRKTGFEEILSRVLNTHDAGLIVTRRNSEKKFDILFVNDAALAFLPEDFSNADPQDSFFKVFPGIFDICRRSQRATEPESFDIKHSDGRVFSGVCNTIDWSDGHHAVIIFLRDVDEAYKNQQRLYELAYLDPLTRVPNRQKLREDFDELESAIEAGQIMGVVALLDLDNFKNVNDTYGHNTGDVMLKRLTDHLMSDENFNGHLYRLGGDEFVFLFADPIGTHGNSEAEYRDYYQKLLSTTLQSYTLPNIDISCTISIGVAFFPSHGDSYSELLRKSDIALYQAKEAGRNQICLFQDRHDTAKKFKDQYVNIQPILMNSGKTFGYELIDRGETGKDNELEVTLNEYNRTTDALALEDLENNAHYFISYSKQLLNPAVLTNLPKSKFIIQVAVADQIPENELALYRLLKQHGYLLALTRVNSSSINTELLKLVDYCKFDPAASHDYLQKRLIADFPDKIFIATGVNTPAQFHAAKRQGFKLFQGFFFKQEVVTKKTKDIDPLQFNYYRLLKLCSTDDYVDFREISSIISSDVALSYKLLRLLNSAAVGLRNISSIQMAVTYLGEDNLKKWISLLAMRGVASDKPIELVRTSLIRAHFGELLAPHFRIRRNPQHVFLVGMLSLLHIALEKTRAELLDEIPVAEDIRQSLLTKTGIHSDLLAFFNHYEYGNWEEVSRFAEVNYLSSELISNSYLDAVKWYNDLAHA